MKQLESDITYLIAKQESELSLGVNSAAYHGDLYHLKGLVNSGADPCKMDYDGRTALVLSFLLPNYKFYTIFICWRALFGTKRNLWHDMPVPVQQGDLILFKLI